ncbi:MAG: DNA repair protein RecO [Acidobacteria bacterium]|nr:DNA repair protein RecO [Acidobacteriota bacterium]
MRESEALILRSYPLGEGDLLVSFLTRDAGRMRGVAKGARRTKSRFGASLEPASYIRVSVFEREGRDLGRIQQCELLESFLDITKDYESGLALSALCEVYDAVLPEHESNDPAFRLFLLAAQTIKKSGKWELPLAYALIWTVRLAGWLPDISVCNRCGRDFGAGSAFQGHGRGGFFCADCRSQGMRTFLPRSIAAGKKMLEQRLDRMATEELAPGLLMEWSEYCFGVIERQIERKLTTRKLIERARESAAESKGSRN